MRGGDGKKRKVFVMAYLLLARESAEGGRKWGRGGWTVS